MASPYLEKVTLSWSLFSAVEKSVKSATGKYPTESLTYAYSANLKTSTTYSSNSTVATQLAGAGFSATSGTSASKYYYRIVSETGTIDLY